MTHASAEGTAVGARPWLSATSYWQPEHFVESAWVSHAPFAFWLMEATRPNVVAELGTHNGFSFFVFAEAAKRLGLPTTLFALDSWEGDEHAGFYGEEVYQAVSAIVDRDYSDSARLVRGYFSDSVDRFDDASIDLLHVDGRHKYEDVAQDFDTYRPKLSDRAVVIFHDTHEFQDGFGVHRYWNELSADYPSFNFEHGHGLGVLAVGSDLPPGLTSFLEAGSADAEIIRATYSRLGEAVARRCVLELEHRLLTPGLRKQLDAQSERLAGVQLREDAMMREIADLELLHEALEGRRDDLELELQTVRGSTSWRVTAPLRAISSKVRRR